MIYLKILIKNPYLKPREFSCKGNKIENRSINLLNCRTHEFSQASFVMTRCFLSWFQTDTRLITNCLIIYCIYTLQLAR